MGFNQKVCSKIVNYSLLLPRIYLQPVKKENLTYFVYYVERDNPIEFPRNWGSKSQGLFIVLWV